MEAEYDLSQMKSRKNPYAAKLKKQTSVQISEDIVDYFKDIAEETNTSYQTLIDLYLRDCIKSRRKLNIQ